MPDDIDADAGETPAESQDDVNPTTQDADEQPEPFDEQRAMRTIRALRQELKGAQRDAKEAARLRAEREDAEKAKLSDDERRTQRIAELERQAADRERTHRDTVNRYEVQLQAGKLGIVDPEVAVKLLDWDALEYGDDGRPQNVTDALQSLIDDKPYLKAQTRATPTPAATNGATRPAAAGQKPRYSQAQIADYDFYRRHKEDIDRAYAENRIDP